MSYVKDRAENWNSTKQQHCVLGSVPSTGASTQAMTSYLPGEISWGHRFERLVTNQREDGKYLFDYTRFHVTVPVHTPAVSAAQLEEMADLGHHFDETQVNDETVSINKNSENNICAPKCFYPKHPNIWKLSFPWLTVSLWKQLQYLFAINTHMYVLVHYEI